MLLGGDGEAAGFDEERGLLGIGGLFKEGDGGRKGGIELSEVGQGRHSVFCC